MAFWSGETLEERLPTLVSPFDADSIDCAAYTLHVGHEYYVSPDGQQPSPLRQTRRHDPVRADEMVATQ